MLLPRRWIFYHLPDNKQDIESILFLCFLSFLPQTVKGSMVQIYKQKMQKIFYAQILNCSAIFELQTLNANA